jgi:PBP1b-binding outer membrane lipoprotein LpoB
MKNPAAIALLVTLAAAGCSEPVTRSPYLVDPESTGRDIGGTDDISNACQQAISSLMQSGRLGAQPGKRIVLDRIVNDTGLRDYDERIVYNKFIASLTNSAGDRLTFLNREAVARERELQQAGHVTTAGIERPPAGADLVLEIEIRRLSGAQTDTLQYTFRLTNLNGEIVWTDSPTVKKRTG